MGDNELMAYKIVTEKQNKKIRTKKKKEEKTIKETCQCLSSNNGYASMNISIGWSCLLI